MNISGAGAGCKQRSKATANRCQADHTPTRKDPEANRQFRVSSKNLMPGDGVYRCDSRHLTYSRLADDVSAFEKKKKKLVPR